ncbi:MAG: PKD repeat protein [Candidatus Latescibacterota bacterium]|jgi:PKD repeat protein
MVTLRWLASAFMALLLTAPALEAVQISLPEVTAAPGEKVRVPVQISALAAGDEIFSSNMDMRFDASVILLDRVDVSRTGSLSASWIVAANVRQLPEGDASEGQVLIGAATARDKITSDGTFFYIEIEVATDAPIGSTSALSIQKVLLNNGEPKATITNGSLTVVGERIKADFTAIPQEGIAPLEVNFTDQSSGDIETYAWDFGDGDTSSEQNPVHVYQARGTYTVALTVANSAGNNTESKEGYITVNPDQRPPEIIEGPIVLGIGHNSGTAYWKTNEESNSQVQYCGLSIRPILANEDEIIRLFVEELRDLNELGNGDDGETVLRWLHRGEMPHFGDNAASHFPLIAECTSLVQEDLVIDHRVPLTGLSPLTFYIYRMRSADDDGNNSAWKGGFFITRARPDDEPPVIVKGPQATPAKNRALIQWTTDEPSNSFVEFGTDEDFQGAERLVINEFVFRHSVWLENLDASTTYYYRVRSSDSAGNASTLRRGFFRTLGNNDRPPVITSSPKVTLRTPFKALIEWRTSKPTTSRVNYGSSESYGRFAASDELVQHHRVLLTPLEAQTLYHFQAASVDASGNEVQSTDDTFVTRGNPDVRPPGIVRKPYVIFRGTDRVTIGWEVDEPSNGRIEFGRNGDYGRSVDIPEFEREHSVTLTGLTPNTTYHARIQMVDLEGNGPKRSKNFTFKTASLRDTQAPVIESVPSVIDRSHNAVTVSWRTNEASDSRVDFGTTTNYDRQAGDIELVQHHVVIITGLEPGTTYQGRVASTDAFGNGPSQSDNFSFSTRPTADDTPPVIYAGPAVVARTHDSAIIEWRTNELAEGTVEYGTDTNYGLEVISDQLKFVHRVTLANLEANTNYHFQVSSLDAAGNGPTLSRDLTFRTEAIENIQPPHISQLSVRKVTQNSALIKWHTNKPADSAIEYGITDSYGERVESPEFVRERQVYLSGLQLNTLYHFRVISSSLDGGETTSRDYTFRTDAERDNTPPLIVHRPEIVSSHSTATLLWRTNEPCYARVRFGTEQTLGTTAEHVFEVDSAHEDHNITITGLVRGTHYFFTLVLRDLNGNETVIGGNGAGKVVAPLVQAGDISFFTDEEADFKAPSIVSGPRIIAQSDTEALIAWTTDEVGDSRLFIENGSQLDEVAFIPEHEFEHQILLSELEPGQTYRVRVGSADPVGNGPSQSESFSFTTSAGADVSPPQLLASPVVVALSQNAATISWETDEAALSDVRYGKSALNASVSGLGLATRHSVELTNLEPSTRYEYQVGVVDASENGPKRSKTLNFTTTATADVVAPQIATVPQVVSLGDRTATIAWTTDEGADGFVSFGSGSSLDRAVGRVGAELAHRVVLANLQPGTTYRYKAASVDVAGNGPSESAELSFTTLTVADKTPPAAPTGLSAKALGAGKVQLNWQAVAEADVVGYNIYRAVQGGQFAKVAGPLAAVAYVDQGLSAQAEYVYRVTAIDVARNEGVNSIEVALAVELKGRGDLDGDGEVGFADFFMLAERFGRKSGDAGFSAEFDFNEDGKIDFADFFSFIDSFGIRYRSSRVVAAETPSPLQLDLVLDQIAAGRFVVVLRAAELHQWQGVALRLLYPQDSARFVRAEGQAAALFAVLEDEPGTLSLASYRGESAVGKDGDDVVARLVFEVLPAAATALVRVDQVAAIQAGYTTQGQPLAGAAQVHLVPLAYALEPNFPNPFNPQTQIRFQLPVAGPVSLQIYDVLGQVVQTLVAGELPAGVHRVEWDGHNERGRGVASGVYFYVLEATASGASAREFRQVRKLMLLR